MKKYLKLSLLLLLFSCTKEIKESDSQSKVDVQKQAITFGEAVNMVKNSVSSSLQSRSQMLTTATTNINLSGQSYCVQNTNTSTPGIVFSTNGQSYHQTTSIYLETKNVVNDIQGSGIAVNFPFKHGKNYTITLILSSFADEWDHEVASKSRWPSLQVQTTNTALASINNCSVVTPPFILSGPDPIQTITPTSETISTTKTLSFTPTQCYKFLRLSAIPNMTGKSKGLVIISKLSITEVSGIELNGPTMLAVNEQGTYTVGYNGFPISSAFTWTVTGGLQIVGSATGPSVVVKATNWNGGVLSGSLNGCENILTKTISSPFAGNASLDGPGQVNDPILMPIRFQIKLEGPLTGKTITNTTWTVPTGWIIDYSQEDFVDILPGPKVIAGYVTANFLLDGVPTEVKKFTKYNRTQN